MEIIVLSCASALALMITHFLDYVRARELSNRPTWYATPLPLTPFSSAPVEPVRQARLANARFQSAVSLLATPD